MSSKVNSCELVFVFVILIYPAAKCSLIQVMALKSCLEKPDTISSQPPFCFLGMCGTRLHFALVQFIFFISRLIYLIEKLKRNTLKLYIFKTLTLCINPAGRSFNKWSLVFLSSLISVYDYF